ncbi:MAG: NTP transferase domain-containing protein, partial [Sphingomonadaceae bacterium]
AAGAPAVVPVHAGRRGNPAGFARALWPRLMALEGDRGAGAILDSLGVEAVAVDDPGVHLDVDRPADLSGPVPPSAR